MTEVLDYIEARSPGGAENVKRRLLDVIDVLADHPNSGSATTKAKLRRFVVSPYPYIIILSTRGGRDRYSRGSPFFPSSDLSGKLG
ncbi:MAG: type II toxin-antitoxin system RelE/ParE family toxin [Pseudomonadota bacterium]|jgi:toxin ParE1/3/4